MTLLLGNRDVKGGIVPVVRCMTLWRGKYQDQFAGWKNMERTWQNTRTKRNARPLFGPGTCVYKYEISYYCTVVKYARA
jgi:hypothetical protein